jgi:hypothetical protein
VGVPGGGRLCYFRALSHTDRFTKAYMIFSLKVLGAVAALLLGLWLGMPGRSQTVHDFEEKMAAGPGRRRKVKKRFVAVAWLQRQITHRSIRRERGFGIKAPDDHS